MLPGAVLAAAKSKQSGKVYNVGSGATVSVNHLVGLLGGEKIHIPKRPGEPDCTFANITNIERDLQWQPQIPIEQGVAEILKNIDYWREAARSGLLRKSQLLLRTGSGT